MSNYPTSKISVEYSPWITSVPKGWRVERLKWSIESAINGIWGDEADGGENDVICIRVADFDRQQLTVNLSEPTFRSIPRSARLSRLLLPNDLLLEKSGGGEKQLVGAVVLYEHNDPAVCSNFVGRLRVRSDYNSRYLCFLHASLYFARVNARSIKQTTGIQNIDQQAYLDEIVAVPPLPIQRAIADFLDRKTAAIDALIDKKQKLLDLLAEKRAALINQAVTKGLNPNAPMKDSGIPWIGQIPAHWEVPQLGHCLTKITYGFTCPMPTTDEGTFMLTANDIRDGFVDYKNARRTDPHAVASLTDKCLPRKGDILLTKDGTLGRVAVSDGTIACINQSVALIRVNDQQVSSAFLSWLLRSPAYQEWMVFDAGGTTIKHIYITRVIKMTALIPPTEEQAKIVCEVERVDNILSKAMQSTSLMLERLQEYRQAVITAAVTGQVDVTAQTDKTDKGG